MKLKDYIELYSGNDEIVCFDKDIVGEYYFYKEMLTGKPDPDFPNVFSFNKYLIEHLDIKNIHERGITLNLYEYLNKPTMIAFAKENLYTEDQYEDNEDVALLLYDDVVLSISHGYEDFSATMLKYFEDNDIAFQLARRKAAEEAKRHYMIAVDPKFNEKDEYVIYVEMPGKSNSKEVVNKAHAEGLFKNREDIYHISGIAYIDKETYHAKQSKNNAEMNVYKIPVVYQNWGLVDVEAQSLEKAIEYAENNLYELPLPEDPQYIDDSYEIDYKGIYDHNDVEKYPTDIDFKKHIPTNTFTIEGKSLELARVILKGEGEELGNSLIYKDFKDSVYSSYPDAAGLQAEYNRDNHLFIVYNHEGNPEAVISPTECLHMEDYVRILLASGLEINNATVTLTWPVFVYDLCKENHKVNSDYKSTDSLKKCAVISVKTLQDSALSLLRGNLKRVTSDLGKPNLKVKQSKELHNVHDMITKRIEAINNSPLRKEDSKKLSVKIKNAKNINSTQAQDKKAYKYNERGK